MLNKGRTSDFTSTGDSIHEYSEILQYAIDGTDFSFYYFKF